MISLDTVKHIAACDYMLIGDVTPASRSWATDLKTPRRLGPPRRREVKALSPAIGQPQVYLKVLIGSAVVQNDGDDLAGLGLEHFQQPTLRF